VDTKLADLTAADGTSIGSGLATCLVSNATSDAGVAEWISKYPALQEFEDLHAWFRPLMNTVGQRLLAKATFGARMRLYVRKRAERGEARRGRRSTSTWGSP
jgi:hypothetical protein